MLKSIIAYNIPELEKKKVISEAGDLFNAGVISEDQWSDIRENYLSKVYAPSIYIKIPLFILAMIALIASLGLAAFLSASFLDDFGETGIRIIVFIVGVILVVFTEKILIKDRFHFSSGVTEAGLYTGLSLIASAILISDPATIVYPIIGFILTLFAAIRYLDLLALGAAIINFTWIIFQLLTDIGGFAEAIMPFAFMTVFGLIFFLFTALQKKLSNVIFESQFVILKTACLLLFYAAGNYFVVRELSIELMGLKLSENEDIPLAYIFYILTVLVPSLYMFFGIKKRSILLIRIGVLTLLLTSLTFYHYYLSEFPLLSMTIAGFLLIIISLGLFKYFKVVRNGFTAEKLLQQKWNSQELTETVI